MYLSELLDIPPPTGESEEPGSILSYLILASSPSWRRCRGSTATLFGWSNDQNTNFFLHVIFSFSRAYPKIDALALFLLYLALHDPVIHHGRPFTSPSMQILQPDLPPPLRRPRRDQPPGQDERF